MRISRKQRQNVCKLFWLREQLPILLVPQLMAHRITTTERQRKSNQNNRAYSTDKSPQERKSPNVKLRCLFSLLRFSFRFSLAFFLITWFFFLDMSWLASSSGCRSMSCVHHLLLCFSLRPELYWRNKQGASQGKQRSKYARTENRDRSETRRLESSKKKKEWTGRKWDEEAKMRRKQWKTSERAVK